MTLRFSLRTFLFTILLLSVAMTWVRSRSRQHFQTFTSGASCVLERTEESIFTGHKSLKYLIGIRNLQDFAKTNPFNIRDIENDVVAKLRQQGMLPASDPTEAIFFFESPSVFWRRETTDTEVQAIVADIALARPDSQFWQRDTVTATAP